MKWYQKVEQWSSGEFETYPERIDTPFFYETFRCDKDMLNTYKEKFIKTDELYFKQDYTAFKEHIKKGRKRGEKYVIAFMNLPKDALMVIPIPREGKDFGSIKAFMDNASLTQQRRFWEQVADSLEEMLEIHDCIYVSTHGLGVPYFHLRLDTTPKYYRTKEYI